MEATTNLSECAFLDDVLAHLRSGQRPHEARLSDEVLQAIEDERVGFHFSRYPFLD